MLADILLPGGTSGPEVVDRIRERVPDVPVLYMSGQPPPADVVADANLLRKPFRKADLAARIRGILDEAAADDVRA